MLQQLATQIFTKFCFGLFFTMKGGEDMRAENFEFDGMNLSDLSMMVVSFDGKFSSLEKITNGAEVEMSVISVLNGTESHWVGSKYKEVVATTFQIAKFVEGQFCEIPLDEYRTLMHWLGTKQPSKFKLLPDSSVGDAITPPPADTPIDDYNCLYWNGIFNKIVAITLGSKIVGLELTFTASTPFAYHEPILRQKTVAVGQVFSVLSNSDEDGCIYPDAFEVEVLSEGDLEIVNSLEPNRKTVVNNCAAGEVIKFNRPIVESSIVGHKVQNDFNWIFPRICRGRKATNNKYSFNLPVKVKLIYRPIIKVGMGV